MIVTILGHTVDIDMVAGIGPIKDALEDPTVFGYHEIYFDLMLSNYSFRVTSGRISAFSSTSVVNASREVIEQARLEFLEKLNERGKATTPGD